MFDGKIRLGAKIFTKSLRFSFIDFTGAFNSETLRNLPGILRMFLYRTAGTQWPLTKR